MAKTKKNGNGDGSVYYSESRKQWIGQVTVGKNENGKPKRRAVYGKTKTEVKEKLVQIKNELKTGLYITPDKITVEKLISTLIEEDREMNIINENSYLRKLESKKRIEASPLAKAYIQSVTRNQIDDFLKSITHYSDSVIKKEFEMLSRCFREAVNRDIIIKNPMLNVRRPKSKKKQQKTRALTLGEQKKLLEILKSEEVNYSVQMQLMMLTGMRMGEINALDVNDVNFDFKIINIRRSMTRDENSKPIIGETTKTYAGMRKIPLTDEAAKVLKEYIQIDFVSNYENLLFWNTKQNTPLTTSSVNCQLSRIFEKFDILDETVSGKVSLHSLRHTYATRCIEAGMSAKVLQYLLGHTDIKVTLNTYCDAFSEFQENDVAKFTSYIQEKLSI